MDKYIIGENAGKVWRLLNSDHLRKWEFSEIKKITGMDDAELGSAIGCWPVKIRYNSNLNIITVRTKRHTCILC